MDTDFFQKKGEDGQMESRNQFREESLVLKVYTDTTQTKIQLFLFFIFFALIVY